MAEGMAEFQLYQQLAEKQEASIKNAQLTQGGVKPEAGAGDKKTYPATRFQS